MMNAKKNQPDTDVTRTAKSPPECPICGAPAPRDHESFPFCSKRCRLVDLGRWMGGDYTVSRPATDPRDWEETEPG
ncbi:MAG: DNA gyrase inhibitor YacG [Phycisphaerales bacterium]